MSIKATIISQIEQIAKENGLTKDLPPLADDLALINSGFDSLMIAILVTRLEDSLGVDPFTDFTEAWYPVTVGDFVRLYENATIASTLATEQNR
jgi:acyl carrier protein